MIPTLPLESQLTNKPEVVIRRIRELLQTMEHNWVSAGVQRKMNNIEEAEYTESCAREARREIESLLE